MKTLQNYEVDEIVMLLQELRYRASQVDDEDLVDELDSVLAMLEVTDE
jgi:hypothetical protein